MGRKIHLPSIRRRNSPSPLDLDRPSSVSTFPPANGHDFELLPLNHVSYTSLKDLLHSPPPAGAQSPAATPSQHHEISIRNRLVKQAAWAYLQPTIAASPHPDGEGFLPRLWARFSSCVVRALDRLLQALWIGWRRWKL